MIEKVGLLFGDKVGQILVVDMVGKESLHVVNSCMFRF